MTPDFIRAGKWHDIDYIQSSLLCHEKWMNSAIHFLETTSTFTTPQKTFFLAQCKSCKRELRKGVKKSLLIRNRLFTAFMLSKEKLIYK